MGNEGFKRDGGRLCAPARKEIAQVLLAGRDSPSPGWKEIAQLLAGRCPPACKPTSSCCAIQPGTGSHSHTLAHGSTCCKLTSEAGGAAGDFVKVHILADGLALGVHLVNNITTSRRALVSHVHNKQAGTRQPRALPSERLGPRAPTRAPAYSRKP